LLISLPMRLVDHHRLDILSKSPSGIIFFSDIAFGA